MDVYSCGGNRYSTKKGDFPVFLHKTQPKLDRSIQGENHLKDH